MAGDLLGRRALNRATLERLGRAAGSAVVEVEPPGRLSGADRAAVAEEGMRLLEFAAAGQTG